MPDKGVETVPGRFCMSRDVLFSIEEQDMAHSLTGDGIYVKIHMVPTS